MLNIKDVTLGTKINVRWGNDGDTNFEESVPMIVVAKPTEEQQTKFFRNVLCYNLNTRTFGSVTLIGNLSEMWQQVLVEHDNEGYCTCACGLDGYSLDSAISMCGFKDMLTHQQLNSFIIGADLADDVINTGIPAFKPRDPELRH